MASKQNPERLVGIQELMQFLGGVPKKTVYKWTGESRINGFPYYRVGRFLKFRLSEVDAWLRRYHASEGVRTTARAIAGHPCETAPEPSEPASAIA